MTAEYERPMIQGIAAGGAKKFDGSRHAQMTRPMKKSWIVKGIIKFYLLHKCVQGQLTLKNSLANTLPKFAPGATYKAKMPAGPLGVNMIASSLPAASKAASTSCRSVTTRLAPALSIGMGCELTRRVGFHCR